VFLFFHRIVNVEEELRKAQSHLSTEKTRVEWGQFCNQLFDSAHTWKDVQWLKSISSLPVVCKGVLTGE
jgi:isopentenyl diphosphate isomerase/L-lactate dehydrogenase-like FMN-dependent dehydrogenase